jgi:hypothetical protein
VSQIKVCIGLFWFFSSLDNLQEQFARPRLRHTTAATKTFRFFWFWMLKNRPELNKTGSDWTDSRFGSGYINKEYYFLVRLNFWVKTGPWTPLFLDCMWWLEWSCSFEVNINNFFFEFNHFFTIFFSFYFILFFFQFYFYILFNNC